MDYINSSINSLNAETLLLSDFMDAVFSFSTEIQNKNLEIEKDPDLLSRSRLLIQDQIFKLILNRQDYLSLVNTQVTTVSEHYERFQSIKSIFNKVNDKVALFQNNSEVKRQQRLIKKKIKNIEAELAPFENLHKQQVNTLRILLNFEAADQRLAIYMALEVAIKQIKEAPPVVPLLVAATYKDKIEKGILSLKKLQNDSRYEEVRKYITFFIQNKDMLKEKVLNLLLSENNKKDFEKEKEIKLLLYMHQYHTDRMNKLYEKEYAQIPFVKDMSVDFMMLEDSIKTFKQYLNDLD